MTNKDTLAAIATEIETLSAELLKVNNYIDILGKPAMDKANEIDKALKDAKGNHTTALTPRKAIKVKAALSLIAVHGHNPRTVQQAATAELAKGYPANIAYKTAIDGLRVGISRLQAY